MYCKFGMVCGNAIINLNYDILRSFVITQLCHTHFILKKLCMTLCHIFCYMVYESSIWLFFSYITFWKSVKLILFPSMQHGAMF